MTHGDEVICHLPAVFYFSLFSFFLFCPCWFEEGSPWGGSGDPMPRAGPGVKHTVGDIQKEVSVHVLRGRGRERKVT